MTEQACASCRQVLTEDPTGLCEDCMTDVPSERPESVTGQQVEAILAGMDRAGLAWQYTAGRESVLTSALPGWQYAGRLLYLSQAQAITVLEWLERQGSDGQG